MSTLVITTALIVIGFFTFVGITLRQKIEAAIHISGKTCFFEIGSGRVSVMSGLGSLPGTGIKHRLVETDPESPFTDFPDTDTPVSASEFLRCAFATPSFGSVSYFAIPYWVFALLFLTPVVMIYSKRRANPGSTSANTGRQATASPSPAP
jgi:hypothetical protein